MRWALLLALLSTSALASRADRLSVSPRLDRRDRLGSSTAADPILLSLSLLPPDSECSGTPPDGVTFTRASAATCIGADGQTATLLSANEARVHSTLGLLVEGSATNVLLHSRDVTNAAWTQSSCSLTGTGMDGSSVARCSGDAVQEISPAAGTRTASVFVRQASAGTCKAAIEVGGIGYSDIDLDGSWQRLAVTYTADGSSVFVIVASIGDGCTIDIDFVQDEAGSIATSPIATTGTAAVRAQDVAGTQNPLAGVYASDWCWGITARSIDPSSWYYSGSTSLVYMYESGLGLAEVRTGTTAGRISASLRNPANDVSVVAPAWLLPPATGGLVALRVEGGQGTICYSEQCADLSNPNEGPDPQPAIITLGRNGANAHLRNLVLGRTPEACQ